MKQITLFLCLAGLLMAVSCDNLNDSMSDAEASRFVDSLMTGFRNGTLGHVRCPDVRWEHIPALLEYGKSTEMIGKDPSSGDFPMMAIPSCPLSSYLMTQCLEGTFALWMVEAARIHTLPSKDWDMMGWPSQNPFVQRLNGKNVSWYVNSLEAHKAVLAAYQKWWESSKGRKSAASIDPLEGTGYAWH